MIVFTLIGIVVAIAGMAFLLWWAWLIFKNGNLACFFGLHDWSRWWVHVYSGEPLNKNALGVKRVCRKCEHEQYAPAGWPYDEDGYVKPDYFPHAYKRLQEKDKR